MKTFAFRILGVIAITAIAKGLLIWLGSAHEIYPEHWVAELIGLAEKNVNSYPSISWTLAGLMGLLGIFAGPYLYKLGVEIFELNTESQTKSKSISTLNEWEASELVIDSIRSLANEHTNVKIIFFNNRNFPFVERVAHAFQLAGWEVNFNKTPQGNYNPHYYGGVEVKGDNRILVESIADTFKTTGCSGVSKIIGVTKFKYDHPKYSRAQNKVWITVGYEA